MSRDNQGSFNTAVPPFSAPTEGSPSYIFPFGNVQATATGPEGMEQAFASAFSLDAGNTALPGGTFFRENRPLHFSPRFGELSDGGLGGTAVSGATSGAAAGPDLNGVLIPWLFYARGFTAGGFTGTTYANTPIVGTPTSYTDEAGNVLTDLWINPMDLPTVPYGSYSNLPGFAATTRTNNKVLSVRGTGETFSANFRSANTDMLFKICHVPNEVQDNQSNPPVTLSVQSITLQPVVAYINNLPTTSSWSVLNSSGSSINRNSINRFNRGQNTLSQEDELAINPSTDLMFFFTYPNVGSGLPANAPIGNVLKCTFPVPVRGVCISQIDSNSDSPPFSSVGVHRSSRIFVEGDFADGSTFTYVMFGRGGPAPDSVNNTHSIMSYLALNSRTDKHIKNLYISHVQTDPMQNDPPGHIDHGIIDEMGPGRFYANGQKAGETSDYNIISGNASDASGTGPHARIQDDVGIKINVIPKYDRSFYQLQKRPSGNVSSGAGGPYGSPSSFDNLASYNEWRKISENQIGKTFGMTGAYINNSALLRLGYGVTFPSGTGAGAAVTGDTVEITMGYRTNGDRGAAFSYPGEGVSADDLVEAFQYEVIKGTTVDGTFIPVWKKTRTL